MFRNVLLIVLFAFIISGCSRKSSEKIILTSNFPTKLIVQEITEDRINCRSLVPIGFSPHTFQPKPSDIQNLENSLLFFYVSKTLEPWIAEKFDNSISLFDLLPEAYKLNFEDGITPDPHFWTDPLAVASIVDTVATLITKVDPENSQFYQHNAWKFKEKLLKLANEIDSVTQKIKGQNVFLFHPSFRYYIRRFGLVYAGSIEEIPGREPSPAFLAELIEKIKHSPMRVIFSEPQLNLHSAEMLSEVTGAKIYQLDPLGGYPETDKYEKLIRYNTQIFIRAFEK